MFHGYVEQYAWRADPKISQMPCPECGTTLQPDEIWLKKGSNSWYTLCQCPSCTGSSNAAGQGVFQRYKLSRRDGLHWSFARCAQMPDAESLARWEKLRTAQLERCLLYTSPRQMCIRDRLKSRLRKNKGRKIPFHLVVLVAEPEACRKMHTLFTALS